jgi:hypothetical protein
VDTQVNKTLKDFIVQGTDTYTDNYRTMKKWPVEKSAHKLSTMTVRNSSVLFTAGFEISPKKL